MAFVKNHIPWAIKLKNYPEVRGDLTYNGKNQSPVWNYFNPDEVEIVGGTASAVNAGTYTVQFKPRMKYVFPNGTKKIYSTTWTINKANNVVSLSESTGDVKIKFTRSFTVSRLGDGAISATSRTPSIATVSVRSKYIKKPRRALGVVRRSYLHYYTIINLNLQQQFSFFPYIL